MQRRDGEEERCDERGRLAGDRSGQVEQHDDRHRAGEGDAAASDKVLLVHGESRIEGEQAMDPRRDRKRCGEQIERQRWPVEEMRIRIAAEDRDGVTDRRLFIRTRAIERQTEPDRNEPKNRAQEDDDEQPRLIPTWTFLRVRHQVDCLSQTMLNHSGGSAPTVHDSRAGTLHDGLHQLDIAPD